MICVAAIWSSIVSFFEFLIYIFSGIGINDLLDIAVIAFLIYKAIGFFRQTRAGQLFKGIFLILIVFFVAQIFDLVMLKWLIGRFMDSILIVAVIVFHPEIRRGLEHMGTRGFSSFGRTANMDNKALTMQIESVSKAAGIMQEQKCGALIVFERNTQLGDIVATGTVVEAKTTSALVCNIFYPKSPLHDGAMILRDGKILSAGCILPLTQDNELNKSLGTRHRAAIGMSENSDAVVVVVSEETGTISVAVNGSLKRNFDAITLQTELQSLLLSGETPQKEALWVSFINFFKKRHKDDEKV